MAWAPDGSKRLFLLLQTGEILVARHNPSTNAGVLDPDPWAVISPTLCIGEMGLLGICFDPNFLTNRHVFVFVSVSPTEQQIIRLTDRPALRIGDSKKILIKGLPASPMHAGGGIAIGADGKLYFGVGDGALFGKAQFLDTMLGKIGRANRSTGAPENDNPYFDGPGPNNDYVWATGFRNPFSMTREPVSGDLWVNSVGSVLEQSFILQRGANAGWPNEGGLGRSGLLTPALVYPNAGVPFNRIAPTGSLRKDGVVTLKTMKYHWFLAGMKVRVSDSEEPSFNGEFRVLSRLDDRSFTFLQEGIDATTRWGSIGPDVTGNAITGGTFYDSTTAPADYRGNFLTTDYGANLIRGHRSFGKDPVSDLSVLARTSWQTDTAIGPDGAIYTCTMLGVVWRHAPSTNGQNLVIQPTAISVPEGGRACFRVSLSERPAKPVVVTVSKAEGDSDLVRVSPKRIVFTKTNWNRPVGVVVGARQDRDFDHGRAVFRVASHGLPTYDIHATEIDNESSNLVLSRSQLAIAEGSNAEFTVRLLRPPAVTTVVQITKADGSAALTIGGTGTLTFTRTNFAKPQVVSIHAAEDEGSEFESGSISINVPGEPVRTIEVMTEDNDPEAPIFVSTPLLEHYLVTGAYVYRAQATGNPSNMTYSLDSPSGGNGELHIDPTSGIMAWHPSMRGTYPFNVRATNAAGSTVQSFSVTLP